MDKFDFLKMSPELQNEIIACNSTDDLKALFASKGIAVPDSKLEAILKLTDKVTELDMEELEYVCGGCCMTVAPCETFCPEYSQCVQIST